MRARIDSGVAILEMSAGELSALFASVSRQIHFCAHQADELDAMAEARIRAASTATAAWRIAHDRIAGDQRAQAAQMRARSREDRDMERILRPLLEAIMAAG